MIGYPVDQSLQDDKLTRYLIASARHGLSNWMRIFYFAGADVNVKDKAGHTVVHHACKSYNMDTLKYIVDCKSYKHLHNTRTRGGVTPLMYAAQNPDINYVTLCLNAAMNPFTEDCLGQSVMTYA